MTTQFPKLELYYYEACPFCVYVLNAIDKHKVKVELMHVLNEPQNMEKLLADTGRRTVPCMYIDGKPMHESADIIAWIDSNADQLEKES